MKRVVLGAVFLALALPLSTSPVVAVDVSPRNSGSFVVEDVGLKIDWIAETDGSMWQTIVDDPNVSLYVDESFGFGFPILADHSTQGFSKLFEVEEGDVGVLSFPDGSEKVLVCSGVFEGTNAETYLSTVDGTPLQDVVDADFVAYTCMRSVFNPNGVLVATWDETDGTESALDDGIEIFG